MMLMKQLQKLLKNVPAEPMVKRPPLQSTKQGTRCSKRRKQCQTHTCFHHHNDTLKMHISRANFQTMKWKNAQSQQSAHLDLNNHGWRIMDESIEIRWMNQKLATKIFQELTSCCCKKKQGCRTLVVILNIKTMVQEKMMTSCHMIVRMEKYQMTIMVNLNLMMTGN